VPRLAALHAVLADGCTNCWARAVVTSRPKIDAIDTIARTDIFPSVKKPGAVACCSRLWLQAPYRSQWHWNVTAPASPSPVPTADRPCEAADCSGGCMGIGCCNGRNGRNACGRRRRPRPVALLRSGATFLRAEPFLKAAKNAFG
jgi:hypothetical protein